MYPAGFQTWVTVDELSRPLCGASRPVHFRGVATVVTQLLSIVRPHRAYFGQKDYQQSLVVRRLALDLHLGAEIRVLPTLREADGLAMSSRNRYLDAGARRVAPRISRALAGARELILGGEERVEAVVDRLDRTSSVEATSGRLRGGSGSRDASRLEGGILRRPATSWCGRAHVGARGSSTTWSSLPDLDNAGDSNPFPDGLAPSRPRS
jgi:hypothetical protein